MQGTPVEFDMTVRRFRCCTENCPQRIFSERFPKTMRHYARETQRRNAVLEKAAFALGGKPAERITHVLGMPTSDSTLLRRIRRVPCGSDDAAKVIGIDDFAFKKGNTYGTIIVNHQNGRPMDMLPDREAQTVEKWTRDHPEIEIVTRDRSGAYKVGIDAGAPQAVQVADRFHLIVNAREALQRVVEMENRSLSHAAHSVIAPPQNDDAHSGDIRTEISVKSMDTRAQLLSARRRERRYQRYCEVVQLHAKGASISGVARTLRLSRGTVRRFLRAGSFPERAPRSPLPTRRRSVRAYETYLLQRIGEGTYNINLLYQEIRDRGFRGSYRTVRRWASDKNITRPGTLTTASASIPSSWRSPRATTWLLMQRREKLAEQDQRFVDALLRCNVVIATATESACDFVRIVRERDHEKFDAWIKKAKQSKLGGFVTCIEQDRKIIDAALRLPWSNGPVEGHVNRLKTIKRQMYGRANFDLLRRRVLHVA